jgi:tRNA-uridine 2-sulfurtransferase
MALVYVGLSGGVDSAVSAALLQQQGHSVVGAFIKIWSPEYTQCTWREDRISAMRVAAHLGIPFKEIDLSAVYHEHVVQAMLRDYSQGITPNPDVACNTLVKFGVFYEWARKQGAEKVATGHYARMVGARVARALDPLKDQSYFLYGISAEACAHTLFPLGEFTKAQVRVLAADFNLPNAQRPDSQGVCFVGHVDMKDFLSNYLLPTPGNVVNEIGEKIGAHRGAALYTKGERIAVESTTVHFVLKTEIEKNTIIATPQKEKLLALSTKVRDCVWHSTDLENSLQAVVRYHAASVACRIENTTTICFDTPCLVVPGQAVVVYDAQGKIVVGGTAC